MIDRESLLKKHYNLDSAIPSVVAVDAIHIAKLSEGLGIAPTQQIRIATSSADRELEMANINLIGQVFKDQRINLRQRENIAKSILKGDYRVGSATQRPDGTRPGNVTAVHDLDLARGVGLLHRHRMKKPRFIEIDGNQASIPILDPSEELLKAQAKRRSKGKKSAGFFLFNAYVPEEEVPIRPGKSEQSLEKSRSMSQFSHSKGGMLRDSKRLSLEKCKSNEEVLSAQANREKRRSSEEMEGKRLLRKKIEEFRCKVLERLEEKSDPLKSTIMRSLSDKVALSVMERYRGFTMSIDAIISLIGSSLGASVDPRDVRVVGQLSEVGHEPPSYQESPKEVAMEKILKEMPYSGEYPLVGRSFGSRAASRPAPAAVPEVIPTEESHIPSPPRISSPLGRSWNANNPQLKRLGAGFSIFPRTGDNVARMDEDEAEGGRPLVGKLSTMHQWNMMSDSLDLSLIGDRDTCAQRAIDALIDEMKGQGTLPSLQPERVISDRQIERLGTHDATFDSIAREVKWQKQKKLQKQQQEQAQTAQSHWIQSRQVSAQTSAEAAEFIAAGWEAPNMDIELGFQPRPISDTNFAAISAKSIATRSTPSSDIERITGPEDIKIPIALKTKHQADPVAPFKNRDEMQHMLSQALPAGVGLALWSGNRGETRLQKWGPRVKTPEGRYRSASSERKVGRQMLN